MRSTKICLGLTIDGASRRNSQFVNEDALDIGTHYTAHSIDEDSRPISFGRIAQKGRDGLEVEDRLHHSGVILNGIDDVDDKIDAILDVNSGHADLGYIHFQIGANAVFSDLFRLAVYFISKRYWSWTTIGNVVFDAEITLGSSGIVTCCENKTPEQFLFPNDARDSRSRKYSIHSDDDFLDSVGGAHFDDDLGALSAEKPAIPAQRQSGAIQLFRFQRIQR